MDGSYRNPARKPSFVVEKKGRKVTAPVRPTPIRRRFLADTLSRRSPPSVGGGGGVWVEHRALRGVWCRSIRGMDRDDCFVSASIMMCGRCAVVRVAGVR